MLTPGVIEVDVRGLDGRGMFCAIDGAVTGAPARTHVRVKVGNTPPPSWLPWLAHEYAWQFVADDVRTLADWHQAARQEVHA